MTGTTTLAPQQTRIADLLAEGYGQKEIAERLGIDTSTVATQLLRIKSKLGARSTIHAAVIWARSKPAA